MPSLEDRECAMCGEAFTPRNSMHTRCSKECRERGRRRRRVDRRKIREERISSLERLREQMKEWAKIEGTKGAREKMAAIE